MGRNLAPLHVSPSIPPSAISRSRFIFRSSPFTLCLLCHFKQNKILPCHWLSTKFAMRKKCRRSIIIFHSGSGKYKFCNVDRILTCIFSLNQQPPQKRQLPCELSTFPDAFQLPCNLSTISSHVEYYKPG